MPHKSFQIRLCHSCGLRYPLVEGHSFGERCPVCLGSTEAMSTHLLRTESPIPSNVPSVHLEALLDNIRSAWNVGSIFRTADGFGLKHLHVCGITPTPETDALKKTSLSAESSVTWTYHKNAVTAAGELKARGLSLLALEESERAVPINHSLELLLPDQDAVLVVGNEITGVDPELLELCDQVLYIPMRGHKKSFNVAVAFAVAVSRIVL